MKYLSLLSVPTSLLLALLSPSVAHGNPVQTPLRSAVVVNGTASSTSSGQCGFIAAAPTQVVQVTEAFTSLRFSVQGEGAPTLLITGPGGRSQCVMADSFSGGKIEVPGVWERGSYSLFVGDRAAGSHPYTLSISQGN